MTKVTHGTIEDLELIQECYEFYASVTPSNDESSRTHLDDIRTLFRNGFHHQVRQLITDGTDKPVNADIAELNRILAETKLELGICKALLSKEDSQRISKMGKSARNRSLKRCKDLGTNQVSKELEFLEQFSIVQSLPKDQILSIQQSPNALIKSALVCVEFAKRDVATMNVMIVTVPRLASWSRDFQERVGLMDKMIHRVVDIISPIASESMPEMLLLVFKNQVELVLLYHKKWNELMDQLGSSPCSEPIQPPMLTIINFINDLFGYYGGYFIEDALSFLLSQMHSLAKESSEDIIPLVQILKSILSHHNPTKCKFD